MWPPCPHNGGVDSFSLASAMPIYAFSCTHCGHQFDRLQKIADPDPGECPDCGASGGIRRELTAPSFRLAGSGWYETDFKKSGESRRNLAGDGGGAKDTAPATAKSDSAAKPAADASPKSSG